MKIQIDDTVRNATPEEIAVIEQNQQASAEHEAMIAARSAARQAAKNKLAQLGLSAEEIAVLVR